MKITYRQVKLNPVSGETMITYNPDEPHITAEEFTALVEMLKTARDMAHTMRITACRHSDVYHLVRGIDNELTTQIAYFLPYMVETEETPETIADVVKRADSHITQTGE